MGLTRLANPPKHSGIIDINSTPYTKVQLQVPQPPQLHHHPKCFQNTPNCTWKPRFGDIFLFEGPSGITKHKATFSSVHNFPPNSEVCQRCDTAHDLRHGSTRWGQAERAAIQRLPRTWRCRTVYGDPTWSFVWRAITSNTGLYRKTGIGLPDTGERDEHGLAPIDGLFSSPEKETPNGNSEDDMTRGEQDMELESGTLLPTSFLRRC